MTRLAVVLIMLCVLVFSAGFSGTQIPSANAVRANIANFQSAAETNAFGAQTGVALTGAQPADAPAPALLIYMLVIVIGSIGSVLLVRRSIGRDL